MLITVTGSYPKIGDSPKKARLRRAFGRLDRGEISFEDLAQVQDEVTKEVIEEQTEAGVELLTDGQVRWMDEVTYLAGGLDGVSLNGLARLFDTNTYFREPIVEADIEWRSPITLRDWQFAREQTLRPVKPVLTGPYTLARLSRDEHYGSLEKLASAYAEALNQEARALQQAGATLIQVNEPSITKYPDDIALAKSIWQRLLQGIDVETAVYFYFAAPGGAVGAAVEAGFDTVGVDATIAGVLDEVAAGPLPRKLAVGAVDSRTTRLEPVEQVAGLIERALKILPAEALYVNPNQGLEFLPREQAKLKLARLVEAKTKVLGGRA